MAIGCGPKISKIILIILNIFFWLSGLLLIILSAYILMSEKFIKIADIIDPNSKAIRSLLYLILILGLIIFVIGFCGCCGAIKESHILLGIYIGLLLIIMSAELACGIYAIVKKNKILDRLETSFKSDLNKNYRNKTENKDFVDGINYIQINYKCCGVGSSDDWKNTDWYKERHFMYMETPESCCKDQEPSKLRDCYNVQNYYTVGCFEVIKSNVKKHFPILIGILFGLGIFEIIVVLFACCLCQNTGYSDHSAI